MLKKIRGSTFRTFKVKKGSCSEVRKGRGEKACQQRALLTQGGHQRLAGAHAISRLRKLSAGAIVPEPEASSGTALAYRRVAGEGWCLLAARGGQRMRREGGVGFHPSRLRQCKGTCACALDLRPAAEDEPRKNREREGSEPSIIQTRAFSCACGGDVCVLSQVFGRVLQIDSTCWDEIRNGRGAYQRQVWGLRCIPTSSQARAWPESGF